jgi:hypothetical protein
MNPGKNILKWIGPSHGPDTEAFYTQTLLYTQIFAQTLLRTDIFTHRTFYTQTLLHTEIPFSRIFWRLLRHFKVVILLYMVFGDRALFRATRFRPILKIAILLHFLAIEPSFRAKRLSRTLQIHNITWVKYCSKRFNMG